MAISKSQINAIQDFGLRTVLLGMYDQIDTHNQALGINMLEPVNSKQKPASAAPPLASLAVSGANGVFSVQITNPAQSVNKTIYHELSYSTSSSFSNGVVTLPVQTSTQATVPAPGVTVYWRIRSSFDQSNWNSYQRQPAVVASGLQSSAASSAATVLNQTNYASVDSQASGGAAVVRVYGKAGPTTQFPAVKGGAEKILPAATIINVPLSSSQVVGFDGEDFQVRGTLPEVLTDETTPVGAVSVVGGGAVVEPTVSLVLDGSGHVIAWNVVTQGNGLTGPVTLTITTSTGSGATPGAQVISGGKLLSISPGNPGTAYGGGDTVTATGGTFGGTTGGGQNIGGNGGRLVVNDGTTG